MKLGKEATKQVRTSPPAAIVLSVRLPGDVAERLQQIAGQNSLSLSDAAREALEQWMAYAVLPRGVTASSNSGAEVRVRSRPGQVTCGPSVTVWPVPADVPQTTGQAQPLVALEGTP